MDLHRVETGLGELRRGEDPELGCGQADETVGDVHVWDVCAGSVESEVDSQ